MLIVLREITFDFMARREMVIEPSILTIRRYIVAKAVVDASENP